MPGPDLGNSRQESPIDHLQTYLLSRRRALQRVAAGRAIARNPAVFLMDEPLSNLDTSLRVRMRTGALEPSGKALVRMNAAGWSSKRHPEHKPR